MLQTDEAIQELTTVLEFISENPNKHDQSTWIYTGDVPDERVGDHGIVKVNQEAYDCGTTGCLAGWGAMLNGWQPVINQHELPAELRYNGDIVKLDKKGNIVEVAWSSLWFGKHMGLTAEEEDLLFSGGNSISDLWFIAEALSGGKITKPDSVAVDENRSKFDNADEVRNTRYWITFPAVVTT